VTDRTGRRSSCYPEHDLAAEHRRSTTSTPDEILDHVIRRLHEPTVLDEELCSLLGCGELENLIRAHEDEIWLRIVEQATIDRRFRLALSCSWAFDSPHFAERCALLEELAAAPPISRRRSGGRRGRGTRR
jgi:hypothetical protein